MTSYVIEWGIRWSIVEIQVSLYSENTPYIPKLLSLKQILWHGVPEEVPIVMSWDICPNKSINRTFSVMVKIVHENKWHHIIMPPKWTTIWMSRNYEKAADSSVVLELYREGRLHGYRDLIITWSFMPSIMEGMCMYVIQHHVIQHSIG